MSSLVFPVVLLTLVSPLLVMTAPLQVIVDGDNSTNGVEFCDGENVTFVCTLPKNVHLWNVPDYISGNDGIVFHSSTVPATRGPGGRFTLRGLLNSSIRLRGTTLSVSVFPEFNNTVITCSDASGVLTETQTIITAIFGPPSAPSVIAVGNAYFRSFNISINPPAAMSSACIQHYNLSVFEDGVYQYTSVIMNPSPVYIVNGLNLCRSSYTFKVVPITKAGTVGMATTVPGEVNLQGTTSIRGEPRVTVDSQTTTSLTLDIEIDVNSCANIIIQTAIYSIKRALLSSTLLPSPGTQTVFGDLLPDTTYLCTVSVLLPSFQVIYYKELNCSTEAVSVSGTTVPIVNSSCKELNCSTEAVSVSGTTVQIVNSSAPATTNMISIDGFIAVLALALVIIIAIIFVIVMIFIVKKIKRLKTSPTHYITATATNVEASTDFTGSVAMYEEISTGTRSEVNREEGVSMTSNEAYGVYGH